MAWLLVVISFYGTAFADLETVGQFNTKEECNQALKIVKELENVPGAEFKIRGRCIKVVVN